MKALGRLWSSSYRLALRFVVFLRKRGVRRTAQRSFEELDDFLCRRLHGCSRYEQWFAEQQRVSASSLSDLDQDGPLISIVMPVCDPDVRWLDEAIGSVRSQLYSNWQLCIVDDASCDRDVRRTLSDAADQDDRIRLLRNDARQGIARSSNRAIGSAVGDYVALLDHDDELTPDALMRVARYARCENFDILYSDEDKIDPRGRLRDPTFKPDRSRELLYACMYFGHLCVYRRAFLEVVGGFDASFDGGQDYDLALRAEAMADRVVHAPFVLYHWRMAAGSAANPDEDAKPWAYEAGRRAIEAEVARQPGHARVVDGVGRGHARVVRSLKPGTAVSILYCECCHSREEWEEGQADSKTEKPRFAVEWIPMTSWSKTESRSIGTRWNQAAAHASGDVLIFVDGVRLLPSSVGETWWEEMASQATREDIGAVGARIRSARHALLHMGTVLGGPEVVRTRTAGLRDDEPGHLALAQSLREVTAVRGGCFAIRRELLASHGGFDGEYRSALHDVDLCLRLRRSGLRILYDPYVGCEILVSHDRDLAVQSDGLPRPLDEDVKRLVDVRSNELADLDPYSSPNFHLKGAIFNPVHRAVFSE